MLTFEQIKELIELVATHRLTGMELERSGFRLRIDGYKAAKRIAAAEPTAAPPAEPVAPEPPAQEPKSAEAKPASDVHTVHSPIVGTFYRAPNPEAPPFAEVGSRVKQGQVICIVEAMKLMNEIESDADGIVVEVHPKNGQPVEYGEPLFAIKLD